MLALVSYLCNLVPRIFCVHGARYGKTKTLDEADDVTFCQMGYGKSLILPRAVYTEDPGVATSVA